MTERYVAWFDSLSMADVGRVGGKNASLGEMISRLAHADVKVPGGFATTADAFREFLAFNKLTARIHERLAALDVGDVRALAATGAEIRQWIEAAPLQPATNTIEITRDVRPGKRPRETRSREHAAVVEQLEVVPQAHVPRRDPRFGGHLCRGAERGHAQDQAGFQKPRCHVMVPRGSSAVSSSHLRSCWSTPTPSSIQPLWTGRRYDTS